MKIKVWGCRGSLAVPGPDTLRYGGNSTCVEIRSTNGAVLIIDAGSGARNLGKALERDKSIRAVRFMFTHVHMDHLMGFPFFKPAYDPEFTITLCDSPHTNFSIKNIITRQMEAPYFPISFELMKAKFKFVCGHAEGKHCRHRWRGLEMRPVPISHPNGGYGFKVIEKGKVFVFLTDNELRYQHPGGLTRNEYLEFCRGADLLFHDAQYTESEYERTRTWGHSTYADATDLAIEAKVKKFGLFHHDPDRTDTDLDRQVEYCCQRIHNAGSKVKCFAAAEGMEIKL